MISKKVLTGITLAILVISGMFASVTSAESTVSGTVTSSGSSSVSTSISATVSSGGSVSISTNGSTPRVCKLLKRNLFRGSSGDDVRALQEFLREGGMLNAQATGYFGPATASAIAKWQQNNGVSAVGNFGPLSRARFLMHCGGGSVNQERFSANPVQGSAPLAVTFDTWISGFRTPTITYTIDFGDGASEQAAHCYAPADGCLSPGQNKHIYTQNGTYTAVLYKNDAGGCGPNADPRCLGAPSSRTAVAKQQITVGPIACSKEYMPVCGAKPVVCITTPCNPVPTTYGNKCMMAADGASYLYEGMCRTQTTNPADNPQCKTWNDGCNSCARSTPGGPGMCTLKYCSPENTQKPYCTSYFDGSSTNRPPTISGFSGPSTLTLNQSGTWSISASDPEGTQLTYSILWGDEVTSVPLMKMSSNAAIQNSTFTHSYAAAGTYTVRLTVRDQNGQEATATATVVVKSTLACDGNYAPVCGQPRWSCPTGMYCAMMMPAPQTYANRCTMENAGATFLYNGACTS